jgi:folate-binding protein YgfZ
MTTRLLHAVLSDRALISVEGPDWRRFLQGLLSNDIEALSPGEMRFAALLTPQGKFLFEMFVIPHGEGCLLEVQTERRDALIERLSMYRLRAQVKLSPRGGTVGAVWPWSGDEAGMGWLRDPRLEALGWRGIDAESPADAMHVSADDYDVHRLALGVPDLGRDLVPDKTYPIEADFDLLNGIDFRKGCFIGQETTSRMKRRGAIKTRMAPVAFEGAPPAFGTEILAGDLRAGEVLAGRDGRAMALLRLDRIEGAALTAAGKAVQAELPPWMTPSPA